MLTPDNLFDRYAWTPAFPYALSYRGLSDGGPSKSVILLSHLPEAWVKNFTILPAQKESDAVSVPFLCPFFIRPSALSTHIVLAFIGGPPAALSSMKNALGITCIIICSHFEAKKSWSTIFGPIFLKQRKANFFILFEILPLIICPSARRWKKSWNRKIEKSIATVYQTSSLVCATKDWLLPLVLISILSARVFYIKTLSYSM